VLAARQAVLAALAEPKESESGPDAGVTRHPVQSGDLPALKRERRSRRASVKRAGDELVHVERLIERLDAYPEVEILDPDVLLNGSKTPEAPSPPATPVVVAPEEDAVGAVEPRHAPAPSPRPGEDLLTASGGGVVLRRRRASL